MFSRLLESKQIILGKNTIEITKAESVPFSMNNQPAK